MSPRENRMYFRIGLTMLHYPILIVMWSLAFMAIGYAMGHSSWAHGGG